jgi:hypothetical protein
MRGVGGRGARCPRPVLARQAAQCCKGFRDHAEQGHTWVSPKVRCKQASIGILAHPPGRHGCALQPESEPGPHPAAQAPEARGRSSSLRQRGRAPGSRWRGGALLQRVVAGRTTLPAPASPIQSLHQPPEAAPRTQARTSTQHRSSHVRILAAGGTGEQRAAAASPGSTVMTMPSSSTRAVRRRLMPAPTGRSARDKGCGVCVCGGVGGVGGGGG